MTDVLPYQGTGVVQLEELEDTENRVWLDTTNTTSVVATLYAKKSDGTVGAVVVGAEAIALAFVPKSRHTWRARLSQTLPVVVGQSYWCKVLAIASDGRQMPFWQDVTVLDWTA